MSDENDHAGTRGLKLAFFLNLIFTLIELVGGLLVNSVAVISDAVHDLGDTIALGTAWFLENRSRKGPTGRFTYGYARFSLFGAFINGLLLIAGSVVVIFEAIRRLKEPVLPDAEGVMLLAILGIVVNGIAAWRIHGGKSMNIQMVRWHLLEDVLGWTAILIMALVLYFVHLPILDPMLSIALSIYILWNVVKRFRQTLNVLLQASPQEIDTEKLERVLMNIPGVQAIHHLHIWSLEGSEHVFSAHIRLEHVDHMADFFRIRKAINHVIAEYGFAHTTIETEFDDSTCSLEGVDRRK